MITTLHQVWVITWMEKNGKLHDLKFNTLEEAEAWVKRIMNREKRDGIHREWLIRTLYDKIGD